MEPSSVDQGRDIVRRQMAPGGATRHNKGWLPVAIVFASVALLGVLGLLSYRHFDKPHPSTSALPMTSPTTAAVTQTTEQPTQPSDPALVQAANAVSAALSPIQGEIDNLGSAASQTQQDSTALQQATEAASAAGYAVLRGNLHPERGGNRIERHHDHERSSSTAPERCE